MYATHTHTEQALYIIEQYQVLREARGRQQMSKRDMAKIAAKDPEIKRTLSKVSKGEEVPEAEVSRVTRKLVLLGIGGALLGGVGGAAMGSALIGSMAPAGETAFKAVFTLLNAAIGAIGGTVLATGIYQTFKELPKRVRYMLSKHPTARIGVHHIQAEAAGSSRPVLKTTPDAILDLAAQEASKILSKIPANKMDAASKKVAEIPVNELKAALRDPAKAKALGKQLQQK